MTERILQLGLLAQDDAGRWMNILFILVVAVFWAIGGLVKVASNKSRKQGASRPSDGRKRETWLQQLAKKAQDIQHAIERKGSKEQPHCSYRPQEHPSEASRPPEGRVAANADRGDSSALVYERQEPQQPAEKLQQPARAKAGPKAALQAERHIAAESLNVPVAPQQPMRTPVRAATTTTPADNASPPIIDYTDLDALKNAILQYEILGKPMALRDPFERTTNGGWGRP